MGIELGTDLVTKAIAGASGVGAGAVALEAAQNDKERQDTEPVDRGLAQMQADANAMIVNSGVQPDWYTPKGS